MGVSGFMRIGRAAGRTPVKIAALMLGALALASGPHQAVAVVPAAAPSDYSWLGPAPTAGTAGERSRTGRWGTEDLTSLVGSASRTEGGGVQLVGPTAQSVGAAYIGVRVAVDRPFRLSSVIRLEPTAGCIDGMAMVIQDAGLTAVGAAGGALGYGRNKSGATPGIARSLAIELDFWRNAKRDYAPSGQRDPRVPHLSLQSRGVESNDANPLHSLAAVPIADVADGQPHTLAVRSGGSDRLRVSLDGHEVLRHDVELTGLLGLPDGRAYVGFTAANGNCEAMVSIDALEVKAKS